MSEAAASGLGQDGQDPLVGPAPAGPAGAAGLVAALERAHLALQRTEQVAAGRELAERRYDDALAALQEHVRTAEDSEAAAALVQDLLAQAAERLTWQRTADRLRELLPSATAVGTRQLPGSALEVVDLELSTGDRVAVLAPLPPGDADDTAEAGLVRAQRDAALTGTCPLCSGALTLDPDPATGGTPAAGDGSVSWPGPPLRVVHATGCAAASPLL